MRRLAACALVSMLGMSSGRAAQEPGQPFRARIDLLTVDVAAVDGRGRPVEDLRPGDFTVKVDGKPRQVVSADLLKVDRGQPVTTPRPVDVLISTNQSALTARRIIVAVDQTLITPGSLTPLLRTASQFVDRLAPSDYAAFIGFPEPGPRIDFTTDKGLVHKAMQTISIGQPSKIQTGNFDISLYEAFEITGAESIQDADRDSPPGPVMQQVLARARDSGACDAVPPAMTCKQAIYNESTVIAAEARVEGTISLRALESLLKDLAPLDGPKSMIVFSAGLVNEDPTVLDELVQLAAQARTTINVIAVERQREVRNGTGAPPPSSLLDRQFEMNGLEIIADRTGGTLRRGIASGAGIFERLESELSAWYVVAVERQPTDPDRQRIEVAVKRKGVTVRSNKTVIARMAAKRSLDELLSDTLSSPFALPGVPLRVATFTRRDTAPGKYQLRVTAQIGQPGEPAGEFALGYVLTDEKGRVLTTAGSRRTLTPPASGSRQALLYDTALSVAAGTYMLRFGVVDKDGRRGAVVRRVDVAGTSGSEIASSDLIVGNRPAEGESLHPSVEPEISASELAGYLEIYSSDADRDRLAVSLEIAEGEGSPALAAARLTMRRSDDASRQIATGFVEATMSPGRYLARATISRDGVALKTLSRPITIVRDPAVVSSAPTRPRGIPASIDLQRRTATYVAGIVGGLANVVAEEDFTLSKPDRRVISDLLLVRYPGTVRDLMPYRDVAAVNGTNVVGREQRLLDLFVRPTERLRERARQIMAGAEEFVPSVFNPFFVIGFLQSDFQSRFDLTVTDAGSEWPREVKAVTFVETGRPTLLRSGTFGDIDMPTRGTAWIEEGTGRILQTELQVGRGRSLPTMVTKFRLDDRLQVMVPVEMRTQNPDGVATYRNFRRFDVSSDADVAPAKQ